MNEFLHRFLQRIIIAAIALATIWFLVTQIYERLDARLPAFFAIFFTYVIAAYVLLPRVVRFSLMVLRRGHIPRHALTRDGLVADPVNIVLVGTEDQLTAAFAAAGWYEADRLTIPAGLKMMARFLQNRPYPQAPFNTHFLFGRVQDHGFQQPIGGSPRQRHHIRFWAANLDPDIHLSDVQYWMTDHPVDPSLPVAWAGASSKDTGIGLTRVTLKITHRVDPDVDEEREYIVNALRTAGMIRDERYIGSGEFVPGKYKSDGRILMANLA